MVKRFLKEYLTFTKRERTAIVILVLLVLSFFAFPRGEPSPPPLEIDSTVQKELSAVNKPYDSGYFKKRYEKYPRQFNYRPPKKEYQDYPRYTYSPYPKYESRERKNNPVKMVDINKADSADLLPLPGIGYKLAARIINYRNKLGGFYKVEQVAETYGLSDSTFELIKNRLSISEEAIIRININTIDVNGLKQHPYIKWNIANAIIQYRKQHGDFQNINDLLKIAIVDAEIVEKLKPYFLIESLDE